MEREISWFIDILESAERILAKTKNVNYDQFKADMDLQDIVIRRFEIIGEAAARIGAKFKTRHPEVPYQVMKDMRNVLIHEYDFVDYKVIWDTIINDLPDVVIKCSEILVNYGTLPESKP
jgi:uncharacterized protein with HEPN domain